MDLDKLRKPQYDIELSTKEFDSITKEVEEFIQQVSIGMQIPKEYLMPPKQCSAKLKWVTCEKMEGHKAAHMAMGGSLHWPNENEPIDGQGWFCHECPSGKVCPTCGSKPGEY